ncbi:ribonuclease PH [Myxococcota bacterium]|nr:ribonuclease PH [Myxococcota bacterium]MBU1430880.1 ribonuclease PH [Myxococcota bacterium]MBU1898766.1 ribonuclease PH [Myxococcota bacterium]
MTYTRPDGRAHADLRPISFELGVQPGPQGSALIRWGGTHVLCAATFEERVPHHCAPGQGWLTAEYNMLPGASDRRVRRERARLGGRTAEIQRLIGRSLRAAVDLHRMGPRTLLIDCDVIRADGGTRCASITGAYVATRLAFKALGLAPPRPVAAVSLGLINDQILTDLCYVEDAAAEVDFNFVATREGIVEVQGTAEGRPFSPAQLQEMTQRGLSAVAQLFALQSAALEAR